MYTYESIRKMSFELKYAIVANKYRYFHGAQVHHKGEN